MSSNNFRYEWRRRVVRDGRLTHMQLRALMELESYANPDGTNARPGIQRIARALETSPGKHASERTVRAALQTAIKFGYVVCTARGRRGRPRNIADCYALRLPATVSAGSPGSTTGNEARLPATVSAGSPGSTTGNEARLPATVSAGSPGSTTGNEARLPATAIAGSPGSTTGNSCFHPPVQKNKKHQGGYAGAGERVGATQPVSSPLPKKSSKPKTQQPNTAAPPANPPEPTCNQDHGRGQPCRVCADDRRAQERWEAQRAEYKQQARQKRRQQIDACALCDDKGIIDLGHCAARCTHEPGQRPPPRRTPDVRPRTANLKELFDKFQREKAEKALAATGFDDESTSRVTEHSNELPKTTMPKELNRVLLVAS